MMISPSSHRTSAAALESHKAHVLLLLLVAIVATSTCGRAERQEDSCDPRCATSNCDSDGACICDLPSNSTLLQGDRPFMGGVYCDTPRTMCDGSSSFWCENGLCNEIIQGENYTCVCKDGHAGDHCELVGEPCGELFCYHNAKCVEGDGSCDCPADWKGSLDCSTPTTKKLENNTSIEPMKVEGNDNAAWHLPVFVAMAVVVLAGGAIFGVNSIRKRSMATSEFHRLRQVQMRGFIEEDEDAFAQAPLSKAELA